MSDEIQSAPAAESAPVSQDASQNTESNQVDAGALDASGNAVLAAPEAKKEVERQMRKLKLKVDGRDIEEEFDPNDDEYLVRNLQLAKASQKRMQEKAELEKDIRGFFEELKKNPRKVLADPSIGLDMKKIAAEILEEEIANSQKSPQQLEKEKLENELKDIKAEREKEKEDGKKKEFERLQNEAYERYDVLMSQAIEASELPKTPYVVKKMADYMLLGLQNNIDLSPQDIIPIVREEMKEDLKEMFKVMPEDAIEELIGKDTLNKIRKKNLAKAKNAPVTQPSSKMTQDTGTKAKDAKSDAPKKSYRDFFGV
jgi:hypothetical protein